jgi:hypothetical protein
MSWYKIVTGTNDAIVRLISQWLIQAYRGPIDISLLHQDLDAAMQTIDDPGMLSDAAMAGESQARTLLRQQGDLLPAQQNVLDEIRLRFSTQVQPEMVNGLQQNEMIGEQPQAQNVQNI